MASIMNLPVAYPCFMPASKVKNQGYDSGIAANVLNDGDQFDFDLLAEYLLDEATTNDPTQLGVENGVNQAATAQTWIVSPDHADDPYFADPLADNTYLDPNLMKADDISGNVAQMNQIVNGFHTSNPVLAQPPASLQFRFSPAPAPSASAPAPSAPAPSAPAPSAPAPAPNVLGTLALTPGVGPLAPAPPNLAMNTSLTASSLVPSPAPNLDTTIMIAHQHKRPRVENSKTPAPVVPSNTQTMQRVIPTTKGGRQKSQAQIDRRRERNRILARRTRLRKKFFFESLQKDVTDLQKENMALKEIVRSRISSENAKPLLDSCKAMEEIPSVVLEQCGDPSLMDRQDFNLCKAINRSQRCFVITDPSLQDNPIVYVSDDFLTLTGYSRTEVLGRNCRFLQGPETCQKKVTQIRESIDDGMDVSVTFVNYTAGGTPFWNKLFIAALRDAQNNIVNFIGVTVKVAGPEPDDPEAGKVLPREKVADGSEDQQSPRGNNHADADAGVMAIGGTVTAAVATAPSTIQEEVKLEMEE